MSFGYTPGKKQLPRINRIKMALSSPWAQIIYTSLGFFAIMFLVEWLSNM
jgi:hypothetical protein